MSAGGREGMWSEGREGRGGEGLVHVVFGAVPCCAAGWLTGRRCAPAAPPPARLVAPLLSLHLQISTVEPFWRLTLDILGRLADRRAA